MAKLFNLKNYEKTDGDKHITMRLKEQHEDPANVITEKQLDDRRVEEKNVILEKLLDAKRTGSATVVTERNLNESKGMFAPLRDEKASAGDINKIEEQRLKGKTAESEKYEAASQIPKQKRWWEHLKDATASNEKTIKTAQTRVDLDKRRKIHDSNSFRTPGGEVKDLTQFKPEDAFGLAGKMEGAEETAELAGIEIPEAGEEVDDTEDLGGDSVWLDEAEGYKETRSPISTMTFRFRFNPEKFEDLEDVRQAALEEVIKLKPNLDGKISTMDFLEPDITGESGTIVLPLIGDEYFDSAAAEDEVAGFENTNIIDKEKLYLGKKDVDGTPMVTGLVYLNAQGIELAKNEPEAFEQALSDAIMEARPELDKTVDTLVGSFNLGKIGEGKVSFMVSENPPEENPETDVTEEEIAKASINDDFQITILSNKK